MTTALVLELGLKSVALSAFALVLLAIVRKRSSTERSFLAHTALLAMVLLPLAASTLPSLRWGVLPSETPVTLTKPAQTSAITTPVPGVLFDASKDDFPKEQPLPWALLIGAVPTCAAIFGIALGLFRLQALRRRATVLQDEVWLKALARAQDRMGFKDGTALLVSSEINSPVSWGYVRPTILLDPEAVNNVDRAEAIIAHELAHVVRMDWMKMILARIVVAVFWFNPFVWRLAAEAHQLREESADDAVLRTEVSQDAYASLLVEVVRHAQGAFLTPAHGVAPRKGSLRRRVERVLDDTLERKTTGRAWATTSLTALSMVLLPIAAITPVEAEQSIVRSVEKSESLKNPGSNNPIDLQTVVPSPFPAPSPQPSSYPLPTADQLADMKLHGVTDAWISDIQGVMPKLKALDIDQLIELRIHGVTPSYLKELQAMGFEEPSYERIKSARIHGVTQSYTDGLKKFGYTKLSLDDLISMRIQGVTAQQVEWLKKAGFKDLSTSELQAAAIHGLSKRYVESMITAWPGELSFDDLIDLRIAGVTEDFVEALRRAGYTNLSFYEALELRRSGVRTSDTRPTSESEQN